MPEELKKQILFLCNEIEEAMEVGEFSSCNESLVVETISEVREGLGAA